MKAKAVFIAITLVIVSTNLKAQLGKRVKERAKQKTEAKAENTVDKTIDKGLDKIGQGLNGIFSKKKNKTLSSNDADTADSTNSKSDVDQNHDNSQTQKLQRYSKYTFIAGEELIAFEDFSNEQIGNLPGSWISAGSAEVVNIEGQTSNWLWFNKTKGNFVPAYLKDFPEDFTLEFDMMFDFNFGSYSFSRLFSLVFSDIENPEAKLNWEGRPSYYFLQKLGPNYTAVEFSGVGSGGGPFITGRKAVAAKSAINFSTTYKATELINAKNINKPIHIAIARNGRRLQVFANETKVLDMTAAFEQNVKLTSARFYVFNEKETDNYYITNIRYAKGIPDIRNKILINRVIFKAVLFV